MTTAVERTLRACRDLIVLDPHSFGYHDARRIFNRSIDNYPSLIVRCLTTDAAKTSARLLQREGVPFSIRGGGHSVAGLSVPHRDIMLDFSLLRRVDVDATAGTVTIEPGALMADLDNATWTHQSAVTGGIISHTGVAGLALGGGLGWLMGEYGLTCDNMIALECEGPNGPILVGENHSDLWAFRGSGRRLGAVTSFTFRIHELPPRLTTARWYGDLKDSEWLSARVGAISLAMPSWITISPVWLTYGGSSRPIVDAVSLRSVSETRDAMSSLLSGRGRLRTKERTYPEVQCMLDASSRFYRRNYWRSLALRNFSPEVGSIIARGMTRSSSRLSFISVDVLHSRAIAEPDGGSAYFLRDRPFVVLMNTIWGRTSQDNECINWARRMYDELCTSYADDIATYENYYGVDDDPTSVDGRLAEVFARWRSRGVSATDG